MRRSSISWGISSTEFGSGSVKPPNIGFSKKWLYFADAICYNTLSKCASGSMDRASDSGSEGWGFESLLACQKTVTHSGSGFLHEGTRTVAINPSSKQYAPQPYVNLKATCRWQVAVAPPIHSAESFRRAKKVRFMSLRGLPQANRGNLKSCIFLLDFQ